LKIGRIDVGIAFREKRPRAAPFVEAFVRVLPDATAEKKVLLKIAADAGKMLHDVDTEVPQVPRIADPRLHQEFSASGLRPAKGSPHGRR
jgi:hypothetical protein